MTFRPARFLVGCWIALLVLGGLASAQTAIPFARTPDHETDKTGVATGGAFADLDRDGWPDLVIANGNDIRRQTVAVYYNKGHGVFPLNPDWTSLDVDYHGHLAVGDVNGDGWLDVAVAVFLGPNGFSQPGRVKLYLNDGTGKLGRSPAWSSADTFYTFSVALGDVDLDGDLDLAVATGEPYQNPTDHDRIYFNNGGTLATLPGWKSAVKTHALDVAFSDVDGDGDLDLAFCGARGPNLIYLNQGGTLPTLAGWASQDGGVNHNGNSITFGDLDGDGRPELLASDNSQLKGKGTFRAYRNQVTGYATLPTWESARFHNGYTSAVNLFDFDRDGDLDLVGGGWWTQTAWFRNAAGVLPTTPTWETTGTSVVEAIFFADVNGDGLRTVKGETQAVGAGRKLFRPAKGPVETLLAVVADGVPLKPNQYAYHPQGGWVSLAAAPLTSLTLDYVYSEAADMGVSNWDRDKGNYIYLRDPLVKVTLTPPASATFRAGQVIRWTEHFLVTTETPRYALYQTFLDLPGAYGTLPLLYGGAWLPGGWGTPLPQALPVPKPFPPQLLGDYTYRVEIQGTGKAAFAFKIVP